MKIWRLFRFLPAHLFFLNHQVFDSEFPNIYFQFDLKNLFSFLNFPENITEFFQNVALIDLLYIDDFC